MNIDMVVEDAIDDEPFLSSIVTVSLAHFIRKLDCC